jgi:hypothetical protein
MIRRISSRVKIFASSSTADTPDDRASAFRPKHVVHNGTVMVVQNDTYKIDVSATDLSIEATQCDVARN